MSTASLSAPVAAPAPSAALPSQAEELVLENGDRLLASEFLRRYERMPEVKKAELIDGIVYMASPVRARRHADPDNLIQGWLFRYAALHPEAVPSTNPTISFDAEDMPQPDAVLRLATEKGGARIDEHSYLTGRPELIVEVAASTASLDLHAKFRVYRRHGVPEYLVWRTVEKAVDWFILDQDDYRPQAPDADGMLCSRIFPGLRLPVAALLTGDRRALIGALN